MKIDRCYILLGQFNRSSQDGTGSEFYDIDLREILRGLYDKYHRFNLKLEAYHSRTASSGTTYTDLETDIQFLHISGFSWLNGYDTNPLYPSSRVASVMYFESTIGEFTRNMIYPADTATLMFSRQASSRIRLEMFSTYPDSNNKVNPFFGDEDPNFLFSITGVDDIYPLYRSVERIEPTSQLILNASKATNLEASKRAIRWTVDLSQVIDRNIYNKYNKFALITKLVRTALVNPSSTVHTSLTLVMSGLNWFSPNIKINSTYTGNTSVFGLYHQGTPNAIALIDSNNGDATKETFIDNIFFKPSTPVVTLSLTYQRIQTFDLISVTAPIEPFVFLFNIVPVDD